jgi:hypothetical protein
MNPDPCSPSGLHGWGSPAQRGNNGPMKGGGGAPARPDEARVSLTSSFSRRFNAPKQQLGTVIRALIDRPQRCPTGGFRNVLWTGQAPGHSLVPVCGYLSCIRRRLVPDSARWS